MKINNFFMIILLAIISFSTLTSNTFAGDDTPDSEVEKITVAPGVTVKKLPDGSESRSMTIPGYDNYSRSTITKDGKIIGSSVSVKTD